MTRIEKEQLQNFILRHHCICFPQSAISYVSSYYLSHVKMYSKVQDISRTVPVGCLTLRGHRILIRILCITCTIYLFNNFHLLHTNWIKLLYRCFRFLHMCTVSVWANKKSWHWNVLIAKYCTRYCNSNSVQKIPQIKLIIYFLKKQCISQKINNTKRAQNFFYES